MPSLREDEGQRGAPHFARVQGDTVFRRHLDEHAAEPVVGTGRDQVGPVAELGTGEGGGHRIAAERDGIVLGDGLLVAARHAAGLHGHIDIGMADEERFHSAPLACAAGLRPFAAGHDGLVRP